jgi:integrase
MQGKQAKIVSPTQERAILGYLATTRYPARERVMFLLSMKAGLRAKEMASLTWAMVTDAQGQIAEVLHVPNRASKGKTGGRTIPLHPDLQAALVTLQTGRRDMATPTRPILFSEWGGGYRREQGDAGGNFKTPVEWPVLFTCHSNPEKPPYAPQTATRHV